jgi:hypothetical protein
MFIVAGTAGLAIATGERWRVQRWELAVKR